MIRLICDVKNLGARGADITGSSFAAWCLKYGLAINIDENLERELNDRVEIINSFTESVSSVSVASFTESASSASFTESASGTENNRKIGVDNE